MDNQNQTNPYMPVSEETKANNPVTEPLKEPFIYTESWMNQNNSSFHPFNSVSQMQPYQNTTQYGSMQPGTYPYIPPKPKGIGFSIAGMICGILSIIACILMVFDLLIAIPGLVFSIISLIKKYDGKGMAVAGLICSACGAVMSIVLMVLCLNFW